MIYVILRKDYNSNKAAYKDAITIGISSGTTFIDAAIPTKNVEETPERAERFKSYLEKKLSSSLAASGIKYNIQEYAALQNKDIVLLCNCKGGPYCHGHIIKECIESVIEKGYWDPKESSKNNNSKQAVVSE